MKEPGSWNDYKDFADRNKLSYTEAIVECELLEHISYGGPFASIQPPHWVGLRRFATLIDKISKPKWENIEMLVRRNELEEPTNNPFFEDLVLSKQIENPNIKLVSDSFSIGARMAFAENRYDVPLDDPDFDVFGDRRIGKTAGLAALEIILQRELNNEGYNFPNLATFLSIRQANRILDINLPDTHPLKMARRKEITRRQLVGVYLPSVIAFGICGSAAGAGALLIIDGNTKLTSQKEDRHIIDLKDYIDVINIKISQINKTFAETTDLENRRQLRAEIEQLIGERTRIESERSDYNAQNYGGKWWRFLLGVPLAIVGVVGIIGGLSEESNKEIKERIATIKAENKSQEKEE